MFCATVTGSTSNELQARDRLKLRNEATHAVQDLPMSASANRFRGLL